jgi:hypothetical protein
MQGGGGEEVSIEELASNLATYEDQLHQVPLIFLFLFSILCLYVHFSCFDYIWFRLGFMLEGIEFA